MSQDPRIVRPMPDRVYNVRLRLSPEEIELLYGIVDVAINDLEHAGVKLDSSDEIVASIVVSTIVSSFLEQHRAVLETHTRILKRENEE